MPEHIRELPSNVPPPDDYPSKGWAAEGEAMYVPEPLRGYYAAVPIAVTSQSNYEFSNLLAANEGGAGTDEGIAAWRHAFRLDYATKMQQGRSDARNGYLLKFCETCDQPANPGLSIAPGRRICDTCHAIELRLDGESEPIGGHTRLEYIQARRETS